MLGDVTAATINNFYGEAREAIHRPSGAKDPRVVFVDVLAYGFAGRRWLIDDIDRFISAHDRGFVWIEAEAGMGKTAVAAHLAQERKWISHFVRFVKGGTSATALRNLAAQLADRYGLVPLPEPVDPGDFESLLIEAADVAAEPIVLVIDGADEAEKLDGLLPWGLPRALPTGVFVVGTYRTGSSPGHVDAPSQVLTILAGGERNREDLAQHLRAITRRPEFRNRLGETSISARAFVTALVDRCGGVWVYLRYVLEEVRLGLRRVDDMTTLPAKLGSYYLSHLERWSDRVVLATLAVAGEPLTVAALATLAGVDDATARYWCQNVLRPFLSVTDEVPRKFTLHHSSFRELLLGTVPADAGDSARSWSEALVIDAAAAHGRICDHYLTEFRSLADDLRPAYANDGYALRHLSTHLVRANRFDDLDWLLRLERPIDDRVASNVWMSAKDEDPAAFLEDVGIALQAAPSPGLELRYLLLTDALDMHGYETSGQLLVLLLKHHVWPLDRVFANALLIPRTFGDLAPYLPAELLPRALEAVCSIGADWLEADTLTAIAPALPPELLDRALSHVSGMRKTDHRIRADLGLLPHLTERQQQRALPPLLHDMNMLATSGWIDRRWIRALVRSVRESSADYIARFVAKWCRANSRNAIGFLVELPGKAAHELASDLAASLSLVEQRCIDAIFGVAGDPSLLLDEVLGTTQDEVKAACLRWLSQSLTGEPAQRALDAAVHLTDPQMSIETMAALVGRVSPQARTEAFRTALVVFPRNPYVMDAIEEMFKEIPAGPLDLLLDILDFGWKETFRNNHWELTLTVLRNAAREHKSALIDRAYELAPKGKNTPSHVLAELVNHVPAVDRAQLIKDAMRSAISTGHDAEVVADMLEVLEPYAATEAAVGVSSGMTDLRHNQDFGIERAFELARLGQIGPLVHLAADLPDPVEAAEVVLQVTDSYSRGIALAVLCRHLPTEIRQTYLGRALEAADECPSTPRHVILSTAAEYFSAEQVDKVIRTRDTPGSSTDIALTLHHLARHPAFPLAASEVLEAATAIRWKGERALALAALADYVHGDDLTRAVTAARKLDDPVLTAFVLLHLGLEANQADLLAEGIKQALNVDTSWYYTGNTHTPRVKPNNDDLASCRVAQPYAVSTMEPQLVAILCEIGSPTADEAIWHLVRRAGGLRSRCELLRTAGSALPRLIGTEGIREVMIALQDFRRWWP